MIKIIEWYLKKDGFAFNLHKHLIIGIEKTGEAALWYIENKSKHKAIEEEVFNNTKITKKHKIKDYKAFEEIMREK